MTGQDNQAAFRALALEAADALGTVRHGERWEVAEFHEDYRRPTITLAGPGRAGLQLQHGFGYAGKITIRAVHPNGYVSTRWSRNVDPARGPRAIATAASTYVLNAGYLDKLPGWVAEKDEEDRKERARAALMAQAAKLAGLPDPGDGPLDLSVFLAGKRGEVDPHHDAQTVSLELHGLDAATALAMLGALAQARHGWCCRIHGPGHHPGLRLAGCLGDRGPGDAGYEQSRDRVHDLLRRHGADAAGACRALDEAGQRGSSVAVSSDLPGAGIIGVVMFDKGGFGEYTVELALERAACEDAEIHAAHEYAGGTRFGEGVQQKTTRRRETMSGAQAETFITGRNELGAVLRALGLHADGQGYPETADLILEQLRALGQAEVPFLDGQAVKYRLSPGGGMRYGVFSGLAPEPGMALVRPDHLPHDPANLITVRVALIEAQ